MYEQTAAVFSAKSAFAAGRKSLQEIQIDRGIIDFTFSFDFGRCRNRNLLSDNLADELVFKIKKSLNFQALFYFSFV